MRTGLLAALLVLAALPAQADTYKWVDAKGVTNYSSTPPPASAAAKTVQVVQVEDRMSTYESDPTLKQAAASSAARASLGQMSADQEWLQRQRLMALKDSYNTGPYPEEYYPSYGYGYYPTYPVARARALRTSAGPFPMPHSGGASRAAGSRGVLVR
jgi:hypothetical protein